MPVPTSQRSTREWLLLFIALAIVAVVVLPLWQLTTTAESRSEFFSKWTPQRVGKLPHSVVIGEERR